MRSQRNNAMRLPRARTAWAGILAGVTLTAMAPIAGEGLFQQSGSNVPPAVNQMPGAAGLARLAAPDGRQQAYLAANAERKKQIVDDSEKLLKMATELKSEVDKTNKDMLSIDVVRKAEAIEKLAHSVKEKMKLTVVGAG